MPRRPAPPQPAPPSDIVDRDAILYANLEPLHAANLRTLRSNWKWAAFSQFFCTFASLLAVPDIALTDIEDDLARPSSLYLPRVMQRLLITLTQDRKINLDNWQSALRRQYLKRLPEANPLGPEPQVVLSQDDEDADEEHNDEGGDTHEEPPRVPSDPSPEASQQTPSDPPYEDSRPNGHTSLADGTPIPESTKSQPKRKPKKKSKAGSRAHSRGLVNNQSAIQAEGESRDWHELSLPEKLDSLHLLMEWQFQNPHRLRQLMKDDDETAQWRVEPIGYDAKANAYWLIGADRLWIQRAPPRPPRPAKRKRAPPKAKSAAAASSSKAFTEISDDEDTSSRSTKRKRITRTAPSARASATQHDSPSAGPRSRAAKVRANKKLDAQAKELAEFQRQAVASANTRSTRQKSSSPQKPSVLGTRTSARLRGSARGDDEWQEIPQEWLRGSSPNADKGPDEQGDEDINVAKDKDNESETDDPHNDDDVGGDDSSELTELSDTPDVPDSEREEEKKPVVKVNGVGKRGRSAKRAAPVLVSPKVEEEATEDALEDPTELPSDFVEWELICITLHDWEHVADRFAKATHYLEKALYKVLTHSIVPAVTAELKEHERKRKIEEAIVHRKRSSRIAIKESEKEEARAAAIRKTEEAEKESRARRVEARAQKEQAEREKRERAREQRRIEREEREERARRKEQRSKNLDADRIDSGSVTPSNASTSVHDRQRASSSLHLSRVASRSSTSTPDWILDCEICRKSGVNLDDGLPMVSCGSCSRWQHITCHDHADSAAGRPRRNWEAQQFYCQRCRLASQNRHVAHGGSQYHLVPEQQRYQSAPGHVYTHKPQLQTPGYSGVQHHMYRQPTSDLRYSQSVYAGDSRERYSGNPHASSPVASYPHPTQYHQSHNGYTQYPADQRNMYSSGSVRTTPVGAPNGYPQAAEPYARHQPPVPVPQRSTIYEPPAMSSMHQNPPPFPPSHSSPSQYRETYPQPQARWSNGGDLYYTSSNGIPSRSGENVGYHSPDLQAAPNTWHRNGVKHPDRDVSLQQPIVSSSGYVSTYNYSAP